MPIVILPNPTQVVSGAVTVSSVTPLLVQRDDQPVDDDGNPYVNPNVPGADIATGDKQTQQLAAIQALAAGIPVTNFPAVQPVSATSLPLPTGAMQQTGGSVSIVGPVTTGTPATPSVVTLDERQSDDDGYPYVNPNVPGADIATGDKQTQQLAVLQQIALGVPVSQQGVWVVSVNSQPVAVLPFNAAQETAGQAQRTADFLEAILLELRVISASIVQLGQPVQDGPDVLRDDITLQLQ